MCNNFSSVIVEINSVVILYSRRDVAFEPIELDALKFPVTHKIPCTKKEKSM